MTSIRRATAEDRAFLVEMLGEAMAWRPGSPKPNPAQVLKSPYIAGWPRPGDGGVVAEMGQPVGAAWFRLLPGESPGYGFIDEQTPEISIGVEARWRGRGIGRLLLTALCDTARAEAFESLCLSVEVDNYALGLYESLGFQKIMMVGNAWTMATHLHHGAKGDLTQGHQGDP